MVSCSRSTTGTLRLTRVVLRVSIADQAAPKWGSENSFQISTEGISRVCDKLGMRGAIASRVDQALRTNLRRRARQAAFRAGSKRSSSISSGLTIRRRIVSAMPPAARPRIRPDTTTRTLGVCRMRASMRRSASKNARSSPNATPGMPPARRYASTLTAMLAPDCSLWRGQGSAGSQSSRA